MLTLAYYLLKVSVCSGVLFSYYFIMLRNKRFHQYNRFYLLGTVILSFIIPVAKIQIWNEIAQQEMPAIKLLKVVAARDSIVKGSLAFELWSFNWFALVLFLLISTSLLVWLITGIIRIGILIRSNPSKSWNNINFIFTEVKGTPFSFFRYIFWNKSIDLQTQEGKHILQHEVAHVQEKHSADKLFLHVVLVAGWLNPFFWLILRELNMIHEFIADEKAISNGDTHSFSAMLLKTAYPQHSFSLANSFFHSPIKRRLIMFTTLKKPSYSYLRKLMILPLLCFVIVFFTFKTKGQNSLKSPNNSAKVFTSDSGKVVVINESEGKKTRDEDTDMTIEMTDQNARTIVAGNKRRISIKTYNVDTPSLLNALIVVDGVQMSSKDFNIKDIPAERIKDMHVLKGKSATEKYGEKGANGVIEITTTLQTPVNENEKENKAGKEFTNHISREPIQNINSASAYNSDTIEAKFPGGNQSWRKYLETNLDANVPTIKDKAPAGVYTVKVQFIVTEIGDIQEVSATQVPAGCPSCANEAVNLIEKGPKWEPATIDGKKAASQTVQFISFMVEK